MVKKSPFEILKSSDPKERLDHLIRSSLDQEYETRREDYEYNGNSKRKRILFALGVSGDEFENDIHHDMLMCKSYNKKRLQPFLKEVGPRWRRRIKGFKLDYEVSNLFSSFRNPTTGKVSKAQVDKYLKTTAQKKVCQSLWCPNCRKVATEVYKDKLHTHLARKTWKGSNFKEKIDYENSHLLHITGTVGLCKVDEEVLDKMLKKDGLTWKRIRRRLQYSQVINPLYDPFIECVYEFELVNWKFLQQSGGNPDKIKEIRQLLERDKIDDNLFLYVHFHGITNLERNQINAVFLDEYWLNSNEKIFGRSAEGGLYIQSLHTSNTLDENIEKLGSYPFKDAIRFKHTFIGSDYTNGEYFTAAELNQLISVYHKVQGRSWRRLMRSCHSDVISMMEKYSEAFPSKHEVWRYVDKPDAVVDGFGNVYYDNPRTPSTYGYNPDSHPMIDGLMITEKKVTRTPVGREYFYHPDYLPDYKIKIYKNVYDETSYTELKQGKVVSIWEYYMEMERVEDTDLDELDGLVNISYRPDLHIGHMKQMYYDNRRKRQHISMDPYYSDNMGSSGLYDQMRNYAYFLGTISPRERKRISLRRYLRKENERNPEHTELFIRRFEEAMKDKDKREAYIQDLYEKGFDRNDIDLVDFFDETKS